MVSVFGDDSQDETKRRVFAIAGVIAAEEEWERLEGEWSARTGGIPFHATDCDSNQRVYANNSNDENKKLYRDLTQILAHSKAWGWGVAIDLAGHRRFFPGVPHEYCYYRGFTDMVLVMRKLAKQHFGEMVKFTFDNRAESNYSAARLYDIILKEEAATENDRYLFPEISFACSRQQPRIQIGDLVARETMKDLDNLVGPVRRPRRRSMTAIIDSERFGFRSYYAQWFSDMRQQIGEIENKTGTSYPQYLAWLAKSKRVDSPSTRFDFFASVARERFRG
jgi:hypothetical protein